MLSSGIARASDSDEEAVSGSHSQHVVAEGDEAQPDSGTSAVGVEHCCHGCVFPIGVPSAALDVLYFAWLRERIGTNRERITTSAATVADLVAELEARSEGHALAFADKTSLRVAVDQELAGFSAPLTGVREVAFFPPMTGG